MKIFAKIFMIILFCTLALFTAGCNKDKPGILFSSTPFSKETVCTLQDTFHKGDKIYYLIYNPNDFKTRLIKVQVFRKDDEVDEFFGYEYLYNKTVELKDKKFHTDYFIINKKGYYVFQIFEYTNTIKPIIRGIVKVID